MKTHEEKMTVDGIELFARYQVVYRDAGMKSSGMGFWVLPNDKTDEKGWVAQHTFRTEAEAVKALNKLIRQRSRGARVETQVCGGIGIDFVVDEDLANDMRIVEWKIRKQWKTKWETKWETVGESGDEEKRS